MVIDEPASRRSDAADAGIKDIAVRLGLLREQALGDIDALRHAKGSDTPFLTFCVEWGFLTEQGAQQIVEATMAALSDAPGVAECPTVTEPPAARALESVTRTAIPAAPITSPPPEAPVEPARVLGDATAVALPPAPRKPSGRISGRATKQAGASPPVFGRFHILRKLGEGGMGAVYLAEDPDLGRQVALKVMTATLAKNRDAVLRFHKEPRSQAKLDHPGIVRVYETGVTPAGEPYIAMEYVDGTTLAGQLHPQDGADRAPLRDLVGMVATVAEALAYAHKKKIVHRDVKPVNVLVATDGTPKLADFGLAKDVGKAQSRVTKTGVVMGTPLYMSPEQWAGDTQRIGPASDQYSLGVVLYEALTGSPPFAKADSRALYGLVTGVDPAAPRTLNPRIHPDLETICVKAIEKDPAKRYPSCAALAKDLRAFIAGEAIAARPASHLSRTWKWVRKNRALTSALAAVVVVVIVGITTRKANALERRRAIAVAEVAAAKAAQQERRDKAMALAREALGAHRPGEAKRVLDMVDVSDAAVAALAADVDKALAEQPRIIRGLVENMVKDLAERDAPFPDRIRWSFTLASYRDPVTTEAFLPLLDADDEDVREVAARVLGVFKEPRAFEGLVTLVQRADQRPETYTAAADALVALGTPEAARVVRNASHRTPYHDAFNWAFAATRNLLRAPDASSKPDAWYEEGLARMGAGEYAEAVAAFDHALAQEAAPAGLIARAQAYHALGQYDDAIADCTRIIDMDHGNVDVARFLTDVYMVRAGLFVQSGDADRAIADATAALARTPTSVGALLARGNAYRIAHEWQRAIDDYSRALDLQPNFPAVLPGRAAAYIELGQFDRAAADLDRALDLDPRAWAAYVERGLLRKQLARFPEAYADFVHAIELNPRCTEAYVNRGNLFAAEGNMPAAIDDFTKALALTPDDADLYRTRAVAWTRAGDDARAEVDFDAAIAHGATDALVYGQRGALYGRRGRYEQAIADLTRAITIEPNEPVWRTIRAEVAAATGDYQRAADDYTAILALDSKNAPALANRALCFGRLGRHEDAITDATAAITIDPSLVAAYHTRALAYRAKGDFDAVIADTSKAVALRPNDAMALNNRADAYVCKGDFNRAITDCDAAIAADPTNGYAWVTRAEARLGKGDIEGAREDLDDAGRRGVPDATIAAVRERIAQANRGK